MDRNLETATTFVSRLVENSPNNWFATGGSIVIRMMDGEWFSAKNRIQRIKASDCCPIQTSEHSTFEYQLAEAVNRRFSASFLVHSNTVNAVLLPHFNNFLDIATQDIFPLKELIVGAGLDELIRIPVLESEADLPQKLSMVKGSALILKGSGIYVWANDINTSVKKCRAYDYLIEFLLKKKMLE